MQHPLLRAIFVSLFAGSFLSFGLSGSSLAGQMHGHGHGHAVGHYRPAHAHPPVMVSRGRVPDATRVAANRNNPAINTVVVPLPAQLQASQLPARQLLGIDSETIQPSHRLQYVHNQARPLEMLSGNPVGSNTIISQLPSGSIVMQSPAQFFGYHNHRGHHRGAATQGPYAPPTFQIIGDPSARHMGKPVKLTYGTPVRKRLNPSPQVIWIKAEKPGKSIEIIR